MEDPGESGGQVENTDSLVQSACMSRMDCDFGGFGHGIIRASRHLVHRRQRLRERVGVGPSFRRLQEPWFAAAAPRAG